MIRKSKLAVQSFLLSFMEAIRLLGRFGLLLTQKSQNSDLISHFSSLAKLYNFLLQNMRM